MNTKKILGVIGYLIVIGIIVGFGVMIHYMGEEMDEYLQELEAGCLENGGIFNDYGEIAKKCEGYDEEGYIFYWRVNKNGDWYKSK